MAFTDDERAAIRNYLGFSELFHDIDTRLETQMDAIGSNPARASAKVRVQSILTRLAALDVKIDALMDGPLVLKNADGEAETTGGDSLEYAWNLGSSYIGQLAIIFEVKPIRPYYGGDTGGPIQLG